MGNRMNGNLRIARELARIARSIVADDLGAWKNSYRWVEDLEGGEFLERVSIALEEVTGFVEDTGSVDEEQIRKMPGHFEYIRGRYKDEQARLEAALKFIDGSKWLRLGDAWESAGDYRKNEYLMLNVCGTEELYRMACEEYDRASGNAADEDGIDEAALKLASQKADQVFQAEVARLRALVP